MLKIIRELLLKIVDNIDTGNSNICEEDEYKLIELIKEFTNKEEELSKYQAYTYLNMRRAKFDTLVSMGKLPKGKKVQGFKELRWTKKELDKCRKHS